MLDLSHLITPDLREWAKNLDPDKLVWPKDWAVNEHVQSEFGPPRLQDLLRSATAEVSRAVGMPLSPVNSFLRRYEKGAILVPHVDKKEIEWTASLRLYHDGPEWPLMTADGPLTGETVWLRSGAIEHWREEFTGRVSVVGLLHWHSRQAQEVLPLPPVLHAAADPSPTTQMPPESSVYQSPAFVYCPGVLSAIQIQSVYNQLGDTEFGPGLVDKGDNRPNQRANEIGWLHREKGWGWLYDQLFYTAERLNAQYWRADIRGKSRDTVQFTRYNAGEFYEWHSDSAPDRDAGQIRYRSLSIVVLLKSAMYGGGLEMRNGGVIHLNPGDAVVFPATEQHRALAVAEGQRDCLVLWLSHQNDGEA